MEKIDIYSYGWAYEVILAMLFIVLVIDTVSIIKSLRGGREDIKEYADLCIKYLKILMYLFAGGYCLYVCITYGLDPASAAIHGILGGLLLIDAAVSLVLKIKYGRKRAK